MKVTSQMCSSTCLMPTRCPARPGRSTFDLVADFAEAEATGARRDLVQHLTLMTIHEIDRLLDAAGPVAEEASKYLPAEVLK